ncbi:MAG: cyclodeaminase/cyclohydrolase family protein, partial [Solirubrobacteraceae bacterium]
MRFDLLIAALAEDRAGGDDYPAGGVVAGVVAALAASLAAAAADSSRPEWSEAGGMRAQAQALRRRALTLARRDGAAYEAARHEVLKRRADVPPGADDEERDRRLGRVV